MPLEIGKLSLKEKILYRFIFNEKRVYRHWFSRFLICGVSLDRIRRVIARIKNFYMWCDEWTREGEVLETLAKTALSDNNTITARALFHEAAGCFHIGQHIYFIDLTKKAAVQEQARDAYKKAIALYEDSERPIKTEIPFRGTAIPGYLRLGGKSDAPLIILINGLDNLKEIENHYLGDLLLKVNFNVFAFDGPGQGEMWSRMKMIPDYNKAVSAIIDWLEANNEYDIDLTRIGTYGMSFGGYLSPYVAAFEKRISCAIGNGGPGYLPHSSEIKKVSPLWIKDILYVMGFQTLEETKDKLVQYDIRKAPPLDRPLLFIQGGKDRLIPNAKRHAEYIINWAVGEKDLRFYTDGEHCCVNYLDEILPYTLDWLKKQLLD